MSTIVRTLKELVNPRVFIESTWLFGVLSLFLAFYGPRLQPKLPEGVRKLFNNSIFRGVILFLVVYLAGKDMAASLTIAIIFLVVMGMLQQSNMLSDVNEFFVNERFSQPGPPVAKCENYENDLEKFNGPVYKLHSNEATL